ncbi:glycosyltransferase [Aureibaculum marinum]|uniref:Glycosyltransferase n=1 Tax=Aureibaculum marinum TaxID=2487930 RepID=A0A3N4NX69_9FLAO|nr:glycosyltransferase [Aureibaculum marinum]RPD91723.1 glycosyltransferase [Aureibaculum marinum]
MKKIIGIYPWSETLANEGDKHQLLFKKALEDKGYQVKKINLKLLFPLTHALKKDIKVLVLDWVHSFYISQNLLKTLVKSTLGILELMFLNKRDTKIIWNIHNLHRHDEKFKIIEKFCFRQLAKKVDYLRVFDESHKFKVAEYLQVPLTKIISIQQGPYLYNKNIEVNINDRYKIPVDKKILLIFGSIRTGKGIDQFLKSFIACNSDNIYLLLAGKANEKKLEKEIENLVSGVKNIKFDNKFIPDEEVMAYFTGCDYVVLPYINTLNSGVLLLARTYNVKVLANMNFINHARASDKIGDLLNRAELQKFLDEISFEDAKSFSGQPKQYNWSTIVEKFEKLINE